MWVRKMQKKKSAKSITILRYEKETVHYHGHLSRRRDVMKKAKMIKWSVLVRCAALSEGTASANLLAWPFDEHPVSWNFDQAARNLTAGWIWLPRRAIIDLLWVVIADAFLVSRKLMRLAKEKIILWRGYLTGALLLLLMYVVDVLSGWNINILSADLYVHDSTINCLIEPELREPVIPGMHIVPPGKMTRSNSFILSMFRGILTYWQSPSWHLTYLCDLEMAAELMMVSASN